MKVNYFIEITANNKIVKVNYVNDVFGFIQKIETIGFDITISCFHSLFRRLLQVFFMHKINWSLKFQLNVRLFLWWMIVMFNRFNHLVSIYYLCMNSYLALHPFIIIFDRRWVASPWRLFFGWTVKTILVAQRTY